MRQNTQSQQNALNAFQVSALNELTNYVQPKTLLSKGDTNAKTKKNKVDTYILYMLPWKYNSKGINLCPNASEGCSLGCLVWAGRGAFPNVMRARLFKSEFYIKDRQSFILQLAKEITTIVNRYRKLGKKVAFRLNGTTDIDFVSILKTRANLDIATLSDTAFFYDYTAILGKALKYKGHPNYVLTFSRKENNDAEIITALNNGINISAVFRNQLPQSYKGFEVVDGDASDVVMLDHNGKVLGLKAKGKAKKDKSNFVLN
jgi:hypothetical protein